MSESADYVVVGAGTAGCVLAARLSEDPHVTVALLELGGADSSPALWRTDTKSVLSLGNPPAAESWGYETVKQDGLDGRAISIARGKVLGGSSAINAMIYIRGNRRDFDSWAELGNRGWSYEEVLPYFKRSEKYHGGTSDYHGDHGPVSVIDYRNPSPASHAFIDAASELGAVEKYNDFNGANQEAGAGFYQSTRTPDGQRVTAASAFVTPNLGRKNLRLLTGVRATRLLFDGRRVVGVEYSSRRAGQAIRAMREVVLCCGAFETPKLLMLSGLGTAEQLAQHGIRVVQHLPGVGKNLQDHLMLGVGFASKIPLPVPELLAEAGLFVRTGAATVSASPDLQYFFAPIQFLAPQYTTNGPAFTFAPIVTQPKSRGSVTLTSGDPAALARVDPLYLGRNEDLAVLEYGIRYAREIAHTKPFESLRGRELAPGKEVVSSIQLRDFIRGVATTVWHPSATCKMGKDPDAVVDDELRVHGVEGLRIADASIMPNIVNGNPNATIMMIAEKAADFIRLPGSKDSRYENVLSNVSVGWQYAAPKGRPSMMSNPQMTRAAPELKFAAHVALRFDVPRSIGETADGVRFDFNVHGTVEGPLLNGRFPPCAAYLLIDRDGVGTINVRAPLLLNDGAIAELEATGRYDFGQDGYKRAAAGNLPNSALGWCPRFFTGHPRYLWLNRVLCLGVGQLRPRESRVDYDLFVMTPPSTTSAPSRSPEWQPAPVQRQGSLYARLGGRDGIYRLMSISIDSLHGNEQLNRQNPKLAKAKTQTNPEDLKQKVTDFICKLTGGPCVYTGRTMKASHAPLDITEADWRIFVNDFIRVMNEIDVQGPEQEELLALLTAEKGDIVRP